MYKNWSTDSEWLPRLPEDEPIEIFTKDQSGQQIIPTGEPRVLLPDFERKHNWNDVQSNIEKCKKYMPYDVYIWWETFIKNPGILIPASCPWYLENISTYQTQTFNDLPVDFDTASPLAELMEKERTIPLVSKQVVHVGYLLSLFTHQLIHILFFCRGGCTGDGVLRCRFV